MASITNAHLKENPPVQYDDVQGSDSEKSSPQSQNRVPAKVEVTPSAEVAILYDPNK